MTLSKNMADDRKVNLTHYQANFAAALQTHPLPSRDLLVAPPGSGKTYTAMQIAADLAKVKPGSRILIIGPKPLAELTQQSLSRVMHGTSVMALTRAKVRELEDYAQIGQPIWPSPFAGVIGMDTARNTDVLASLSSVVWDLVIIEEVNLFARSRPTLLKTILSDKSFLRVLMLSRTPDLQSFRSPFGEIHRTVWSETDFNNWEGGSILQGLIPKEQIIPYQQSPDELSIFHTVDSVMGEFSSTPSALLAKKNVTLAAASSPLALERTIRTLRNNLAHPRGSNFDITSVETKEVENLESEAEILDAWEGEPNSWVNPGRALRSLNLLIEELENLGSDSKLEALQALLNQVNETPEPKINSTCIFCRFPVTANYVHSVLANSGRKSWLLTAGMSTAEQNSSINGIETEGGVLVATKGSLVGLELDFIPSFIHYDTPQNAREMYIRTSRNPHAVNYLFKDESKPNRRGPANP
ncbi:MAG: DEAD/DEAH box helicase family protein [Betaproteobacteria bacterium]